MPLYYAHFAGFFITIFQISLYIWGMNTSLFYVYDEKGILHDITNTSLIQSHLKSEKTPTVDELLDWRNRLNELMANDTEYPKSWYENEIRATDYLLAHRC